jgi:hypothetical protein
LNGTHRVETLQQVNPFAEEPGEAQPEKQII